MNNGKTALRCRLGVHKWEYGHRLHPAPWGTVKRECFLCGTHEQAPMVEGDWS